MTPKQVEELEKFIRENENKLKKIETQFGETFTFPDDLDKIKPEDEHK